MPCDILIVGQAGKPTGFARVLETIAFHLQSHFNIVYFGHNYYDVEKNRNYINRNYIFEPNRIIGDIMGVIQLPVIIQRYKPKIIFMCHDYWFYAVHRENLKRLGFDRKVIYYCPVDECTPDKKRAGVLSDVPLLVLYTNYARQTFLKEWNLALQETGNSMPRIEIIPHGVDTAKFYPLKGRKLEARHALFPGRNDMKDAFIVLNANRNSPRKRINLTMEGFSEFARGKNRNIYLYFIWELLIVELTYLNMQKNLEFKIGLFLVTLKETFRILVMSS